MPGVGPLTTLEVEAFAPDMALFKSGRDFAAWLGLVPSPCQGGGPEFGATGGAKVKADVRASHPPTMPQPSMLWYLTSGVEH